MAPKNEGRTDEVQDGFPRAELIALATHMELCAKIDRAGRPRWSKWAHVCRRAVAAYDQWTSDALSEPVSEAPSI